MQVRSAALGVVAIVLVSSFALAAEPIIVPFVTDPSPVIDGNLDEWANRGVLRELTGKEHATFSPESWKSNEDLSGWVRFGWDDDHLYVACHVVDDVFAQDQSAVEVWRGDHVMLTVDFIRSGDMQNVWQLGLSPGNLGGAGEAGPEIKPELVIWEPQGNSIEGGIVLAQRTPEGYDIEAAVPWAIFGIKGTQFMTFGLQLGFSDCDVTPTTQEKVVSISTEPWRPRDPERLTPAGLADRAGSFPAEAFAPATTLADELRIAFGETKTLEIAVPQVVEGRVPTLTFKGRVHSERPGGCCGPLAISVNGTGISMDNIANRPKVVTFVSGGMQTTWYGAGVTLWYGPSFEAIEKSAYKPLEAVSYDVTLRLDGMIQPGTNTIEFRNADNRPEVVIVLADVAFRWSSPSGFAPPKEWQPAPEGSLSTFEPWTRHKVDYTVNATNGGALQVNWADRQLIFESRFSLPAGEWAELKAGDAPGWNPAVGDVKLPDGETLVTALETRGLRLVRSYVAEDECVLVRDRLTNTADEDRPTIISHHTKSTDHTDLWLGGRPIPMKTGASSVPSNPSVVVLHEDTGFGIMPADDIFRVHYRGSYDGETAEIGDRQLVLRPGVEYLHEWLIFPLSVGDYWRFANAARRHFGTNFPIPGSFCFFGLHKEDLPLLPWEIKDYLDHKNANLVSVDLGESYKGLFPHGPHKRDLNPRKAVLTNKVIRALRPETKLLSYFNTFDCARPSGDPVEWPECRILLPDGRQVSNGATYPLYFATLDNEYGRQMLANVDWLLDKVGADGIYWDCYSYANVTHYGDPWDGWSGDINPDTHTLTRKKSMTILITWALRESITKRLLDEGRPLVANGNPCLTSEYKYRFPRFVETADISSLSQTHLFTPIALGDHITERSEVDSYHWMLSALDWGGLYYWYPTRVIPTRHTLTTYMFPFTPIELHRGYIIGQERILTKVSGLFGWGDNSDFEAHVFDRTGKEVDTPAVPKVERDGKTYAEVRIAEGYSVAIVRK